MVVTVDQQITGMAVDSTTPRVYGACGSSGVSIVDFSIPSVPIILSTFEVDTASRPVHASAVDYLENRLYVADVYFGLRIVDVSYPTHPTQAGAYEMISRYVDEEGEEGSFSGGAINVKVRKIGQSKYAFILDKYYGLEVFNVDVDSAPCLLDQYDMRSNVYYGQLSEVVDIEVDDGYAYVTDKTHGVTVIELFSDPLDPETIHLSKAGQIETPGSASGLWLSNDILWVADSNQGLFVADISNRSQPVHVGGHMTTGAYSVLMMNESVYLAECSEGLLKLDPSGPFEYQNAGTFSTPAAVDGLFAGEARACLTKEGTPNGQLWVLDLSTTGEYALEGYMETPGQAKDVVLFKESAYIADGPAGVTRVDLQHLPDLTSGDQFMTGGDSCRIALFEYIPFINNDPWALDGRTKDEKALDEMSESPFSIPFCIITDGVAGVTLASFNEAGALDPMASIPVTHAISAVYYEKSVAQIEQELKDNGVSTPDSDDETSSNENEDIKAIPYTVVVTGEELLIFNISDKENPIQEGRYNTEGSASDVIIKDRYAVVANGKRGVLLLDMTTPSAPVLLDRMETGGSAQALFVDAPYIHVADGENGVVVLGIASTDPATLVEIDAYDTPGNLVDIHVTEIDSKRYTIAADSNGSFLSFLHTERLGGGINEQPFTESPDDSGWDRADSSHCFISTLF